MAEMDNSVAMDEAISMEAPADDAQAAEISAEALMGNLTGGAPEAEQAENSGDGGQAEEAQQGETQQQEAESEKVGKRIAAALRQQRRTIFEQLGASEDEVRELIRASKAEKLSKEDPDISPKAARRIVEAEERHAGEDAQKQAITQGIQSLFEDGWTSDELRAFSMDATVREDIAAGRSVRQAATAYLRRGRSAQEQSPAGANTRRGVPTLRSQATAPTRDRSAIDDMTDAEFAAFSERAMEAAMSGKRVLIR